MKLGEITVFYVVQEGLELVVKKVSKKIFQKKEKSSNVGKITNMIRYIRKERNEWGEHMMQNSHKWTK